MTPSQIALVNTSFGRILPHKEQVAELFFCRLFELDPSLRLMFRSDMTEEKQKLMEALALVVPRLDKMESLRPSMLELGRRHRSHGVQKRHYDVVGEALLWTLEIGLGSSWSKDMAAAWQLGYRQLAAMMIEGADTTAPSRAPGRVTKLVAA